MASPLEKQPTSLQKELYARQSRVMDGSTRKDSLFAMVDEDHSGSIDQDEFTKLYDIIRNEAREEMEKERSLADKAQRANRRVRMLFFAMAIMAAFLAASVAANFGIIFYVVDAAVTTSTESTDMTIKGTDAIVGTREALIDVPLFTGPVLPADELAGIRYITADHYQPGAPVDVNGADGYELDMVKSTWFIEEIVKHNNTWVDLLTTTGKTISLKNGAAHMIDTDGHSWGLCAGSSSCAALRVDADSATTLVAQALTELRAIGVEKSMGYFENGTAMQTTPPEELIAANEDERRQLFGTTSYTSTTSDSFLWIIAGSGDWVSYKIELTWVCTVGWFGEWCNPTSGTFYYYHVPGDATEFSQWTSLSESFLSWGSTVVVAVPSSIETDSTFPGNAIPGGFMICEDDCTCMSMPPLVWNYEWQEWEIFSLAGDCDMVTIATTSVVCNLANYLASLAGRRMGEISAAAAQTPARTPAPKLASRKLRGSGCKQKVSQCAADRLSRSPPNRG